MKHWQMAVTNIFPFKKEKYKRWKMFLWQNKPLVDLVVINSARLILKNFQFSTEYFKRFQMKNSLERRVTFKTNILYIDRKCFNPNIVLMIQSNFNIKMKSYFGYLLEIYLKNILLLYPENKNRNLCLNWRLSPYTWVENETFFLQKVINQIGCRI